MGSGWERLLFGVIPDGAGATVGVDSDLSQDASETNSTMLFRFLQNERKHNTQTVLTVGKQGP